MKTRKTISMSVILSLLILLSLSGCAASEKSVDVDELNLANGTNGAERITMEDQEAAQIQEFLRRTGVSEEEYYQALEDEKKKITLVLNNEANTADINALVAYLNGLSEVNSIDFTSKEQALEQWRSKAGEVFADQLEVGVLPGIIEIFLYDSADVPRISELLLSQESYLAINATPDNPADSIKTYL
jgi:hypothetical protein